MIRYGISAYSTQHPSRYPAPKFRPCSADLELGLTFADISVTSQDAETRNRSRDNARIAFFAIRDELLPRCSLDESQQATIYRKLCELRSRLEQLGEHLGAL
jgi:hypothetical protein